MADLADDEDDEDRAAVRTAVQELEDSGALHEYAAAARDDAPCAQALAHFGHVQQHTTM